jgi:transposase-like protein
MSHSHHHRHSHRPSIWKSFLEDNIIARMWESFWSRPEITCPKCQSTLVEYYDPFFFAPIRTLGGRRRFVCTNCRFVWRKSRAGQSLFGKPGIE